MFVGITRAEQELQISLSQYRDFRGQRKMTIPSHFLMELPREEMDLEAPHVADWAQAEPAYEEPVFSREDPATTAPSIAGIRLTTAAELANGGAAEPVSPDAFSQGMLVRHPKHGLGRVVALSGTGAGRKATIDFASAAGRKKFVLSGSPLQPVGNNQDTN